MCDGTASRTWPAEGTIGSWVGHSEATTPLLTHSTIHALPRYTLPAYNPTTTLHCTLNTLHRTLHTLHTTLHTLHCSTPYSLHQPTPTLHPTMIIV